MKFRIPKTWAELCHKGEHFFHMSYLGMVTVEGHGYYRFAAAALLCVTAAGVFAVHSTHHQEEGGNVPAE